MNQKTKVVLAGGLVLLILIGLGVYLFRKPAPVSTQPVNSIPAPIPVGMTPEIPKDQQVVATANSEKTPVAVVPAQVIEGEFISANDKQIYLKFADGKGAAININAKTPVSKEGDPSVKNLSSLKPKSNVSVKVNENTDALEILIKK